MGPRSGLAGRLILPLASGLLALQRSGAATDVKVVGRQLIVDGKPLHLKGVCWNPVPKGGVHPLDLDFRGFVASDSELMAGAGINAVRTYETINDTEVLDVLWKHKIYVLNTVYIWGKAPIESVVAPIKAVKDHPAILMWVVGNEWNYNGLYVGLPFPESLAKVAQAVHKIKETDPNHPVATVHGEMPSTETLDALREVDVWGINKYSGITFGDLFTAWEDVSGAPMFLGEYGADAYNAKDQRVDEASQAEATTKLTEEIVAASSVNGGVCIGGIIFEWADEYWKDGQGNPRKHDVGGVSPGGGPYPDMTFNEEWWGLVEMDGTPREAYKAYAAIEVPGLPATSQSRLTTITEMSKPRMQACGAHPGCSHKLGNCCPGGQKDDACCGDTSTFELPTQHLKPTTTWIPPHQDTWHTPQTEQPSVQRHRYNEERGQFANGHFKVGLMGCEGVGECQFLTRQDAQAFCDMQETCGVVLLHPFEDNCAGGFGCYTARFGNISTNNLWDRSGGKAWIKGEVRRKQPSDSKGPAKGGDLPRYVFVGFVKAVDAQTACSPYGRLAMPKTEEQQAALLEAVDATQAAGKMSKNWPENTIWLGGRWIAESDRWEWDDGTPISSNLKWAPGQPSAEDQATEPWLCMMDIEDGEMHDSEPGSPPYEFGAMCEMDRWLGEAREHVERKKEAPRSTEASSSSTSSTRRPEPSRTTSSEASTPAPVPVTTWAAVATPPLSTTPRAHARSKPRTYGGYRFVGIHGPAEARRVCGDGWVLVMPKTDGERKALKAAVGDALDAGDMSPAWPGNTIWLGGQWNSASERWEWDDGSPIASLPWGNGQPSSKDNQDNEPWLCMVHESRHKEAKVHDSEMGPPYLFGVMCEKEQSVSVDTVGIPRQTSTVARSGLVAAEERMGYHFLGFATPLRARHACRAMGHLPMPKTIEDMQELQQAVLGAVFAGQMTTVWPTNTIWLGGRWSTAQKEWQWDDGSSISKVSWGIEPRVLRERGREPWLCMAANGTVLDAEPLKLGVLCQVRKGHHRQMLALPPTPPPASSARGNLSEGAHRGHGALRGAAAAAQHSHMASAWIRGPDAASCDEACRKLGGCREDWPQSLGEFEQLVYNLTGQLCPNLNVGRAYNPSTTGDHCSWQGPAVSAARSLQRCGVRAPAGTRRLCPCREGAGAHSTAPPPSSLWS